MNEEEQYYPDWLCEAIIEDFLPWDSAKGYTYDEFAEKYTLHDSSWIGVFANIAYEDTVVSAIIWDAVWLPDEIAKSTLEVKQWPFLFIKIENVSGLSTRNYQDIGNLQRSISGADFRFGREGEKSLTVIDHYGAEVEVIFRGEMRFLGLNREKQLLSI